MRGVRRGEAFNGDTWRQAKKPSHNSSWSCPELLLGEPRQNPCMETFKNLPLTLFTFLSHLQPYPGCGECPAGTTRLELEFV